MKTICFDNHLIVFVQRVLPMQKDFIHLYAYTLQTSE